MKSPRTALFFLAVVFLPGGILLLLPAVSRRVVGNMRTWLAARRA